MGWISRFVILLYLSLLCTPQALAVHDPRLSPLADTELQAVTPSLQQVIISSATEPDHDAPPALLSEPVLRFAQYSSVVTQNTRTPFITSASVATVQARAPPFVL